MQVECTETPVWISLPPAMDRRHGPEKEHTLNIQCLTELTNKRRATYSISSLMVVVSGRMFLVGIFNGRLSNRTGSQNEQQNGHNQDRGHHEEVVVRSKCIAVRRSRHWN